MPWSNNSGGPWGGGSSGGGGGRNNPWGSPPPGGGNGRGGGGGNGPQPPNLDELFRQSQERLKRTFGGGGSGGGMGGGLSKAGMLLAGVLALGFYAWLCFYQVGTDENAVVLRFGDYSSTQPPGAHFRIWPIDTVEIVPVTRVNKVDIGFRSGDPTGRSAATRNVESESLMLAGDENILDINFSVFWVIADPQKYIFNISDPEETVKAVAESAMREVVGRSEAEFIRGRGRQETMQDVQELIQNVLNSYDAGVTITQVQLDKADPPPLVIDDFRDVQAAQQDQDRLKNQADAYSNQKVAQARGEAAQMLEEAEAYRARVVAEAEGEAARFKSIYDQYVESKDVIRKRMYLETMERVFGGMNKILLDESSEGSGVVPYLPLNELQKKAPQQ